jgi:hypothetical protein
MAARLFGMGVCLFIKQLAVSPCVPALDSWTERGGSEMCVRWSVYTFGVDEMILADFAAWASIHQSRSRAPLFRLSKAKIGKFTR